MNKYFSSFMLLFFASCNAMEIDCQNQRSEKVISAEEPYSVNEFYNNNERTLCGFYDKREIRIVQNLHTNKKSCTIYRLKKASDYLELDFLMNSNDIEVYFSVFEKVLAKQKAVTYSFVN